MPHASERLVNTESQWCLESGQALSKQLFLTKHSLAAGQAGRDRGETARPE